MKVIDYHNHLMKADPEGEALLREMDRNDVEKTLIMGSSESSMYSATTEQVAPVFKKHPDRLIAGVCVDRPYDADYAVARLHKYRDLGFTVLKLFPFLDSFYPDDERVMPLYEEATRAGMHVVYHMGGGNTGLISDGQRKLIASGELSLSSKFGRSRYVDALPFRFPDTVFIMAHMGAPDYEEAAYMIWNHPNVYVDCSCTAYRPVFKGLKAKEDYLIKPLKFDKVLFGLDASPDVYEARIRETRELMVELGWEAHVEDVFYNNAKRLIEAD